MNGFISVILFVFKIRISKMMRIYLIKNISPWMLNELLAFSEFIKFRIILLRKPSSTYSEDLEELEKRDIEIFIRPFRKTPCFKKSIFSILFFFKNFYKFWGRENFIFGLKAIYWFVLMDDNVIFNNASIHAQFATQASIIAQMYKKYMDNVNYSFTFHAYDIYFNNRWFTELVNDSYVSFSVSQFNINYVFEKYNQINKDKIKLSRLGVFKPKKIRIKRKTSTDVLVIGFLGWFVEKKGIKYLLEAMKRLIDRNFDIKLIIAGDGPLKQDILDFIASNNIKNRIDYIGKVYGREKEEFFYTIDIFILPSIMLPKNMEGIPVVLMEAIAYGVPIISTKISGIPEICKNGYNGYLIKERSVDDIVKSIIAISENRDLLSKFSENSLSISKIYDLEENSRIKLKKMGWI